MTTYITGLDLSDNKNVLLLAPDHMEEEDIFALKQELASRFPNCTFTILSSGFQMVATSYEPYHYEIEEYFD